MTPAFLNVLRLHVAAEAYRHLPPDDLWAKVRDALDETAFRVLLERIGGRVYQRCRAILRDDHLAEESFQNTFRDLVRKRADIPTFQSAAAWAFRTATNHARHLRRKSWSRRDHGLNDAITRPDTQVVPQADHADEVAWLLADLPVRYRQPIELVFWQGLTHAEAAGVLGWPKGTVDAYVARGLKRLRKKAAQRCVPVAVVSTALAQPPAAVPEPALDRLAAAAWTAGCTPPPAGHWWLSWKAVACGVACAGLVAGGVAIGWRPAEPDASARAEGPAVASETLQERNARIARDELSPQFRELLQRFYPPPHEVSVAHVQAVGSVVEVECLVTPPVPAATGLATRLRARYCTALRRLTIRGQPDGETRWYWMNPEKPLALKIPTPFGPPVEVVRGREEYLATEQLFARLPADDRAESEQIRALFGPPGGELLMPTDNRGVSGFSGGLILVAELDGLFVRDASGRWRAAGTCPGWAPVVADGRVYCYDADGIQSRPLDNPNARWEKWGDRPPLRPGEPGHGQLFVAGGRACMTIDPQGLASRPLNDPKAEWKRSSHSLGPHGVAEVGDTLFGTDGKRLYKRSAAQPDADWVPAGPWPTGDDRLIADGTRLLAYPWGPGPIYSRPAAAGPDVPWQEVGRVHDPFRR